MAKLNDARKQLEEAKKLVEQLEAQVKIDEEIAK